MAITQRMKRLEFWHRMLKAEQHFMGERGNDLAGYVAFYTPYGRAFENIKDIYEADLMNLRKCEAMVDSLTPKGRD